MKIISLFDSFCCKFDAICCGAAPEWRGGRTAKAPAEAVND